MAPFRARPDATAEHTSPTPATLPTQVLLKVEDQLAIQPFSVGLPTPLRKLMAAFCRLRGLQVSQVRFMVDGKQILPVDTAEKLAMHDNDVIDVSTL